MTPSGAQAPPGWAGWAPPALLVWESGSGAETVQFGWVCGREKQRTGSVGSGGLPGMGFSGQFAYRGDGGAQDSAVATAPADVPSIPASASGSCVSCGLSSFLPSEGPPAKGTSVDGLKSPFTSVPSSHPGPQMDPGIVCVVTGPAADLLDAVSLCKSGSS